MAVLLAAGEGRRLGSPKALVRTPGGETLLASVARTFAAAGARVVAVVGAQGEAVRAAHPALECVDNPGWTSGQLGSARLGLARALALGADAVALHPVDVPRVPAGVLEALFADVEARGGGCCPRAPAGTGHPLVLSAQAARAVLANAAAGSLREASAPLGLRELPVDDARVCENLNTPDDYRALFGAPVPGARVP